MLVSGISVSRLQLLSEEDGNASEACGRELLFLNAYGSLNLGECHLVAVERRYVDGRDLDSSIVGGDVVIP